VAEQELLDRTRQELRERLKELEPVVREHERIRSALAALESQGLPARGRERQRSQRARRKQAKRAGPGERREQVLRVVGEEPGLRPSEAARRVGIQPSQLHALVKRLEDEGAIERRDGNLYPASVGAASDPSQPGAA
jgi:hypothetical protein